MIRTQCRHDSRRAAGWLGLRLLTEAMAQRLFNRAPSQSAGLHSPYQFVCIFSFSCTPSHLSLFCPAERVKRYVGVLKKFKSSIEGCVIEGQMDPAVVGKFKMTPVVSSMAKDLKEAAKINDSVSACTCRKSCADLHIPRGGRTSAFVSLISSPYDGASLLQPPSLSGCVDAQAATWRLCNTERSRGYFLPVDDHTPALLVVFAGEIFHVIVGRRNVSKRTSSPNFPRKP